MNCAPRCLHCGELAELVTGRTVYPHRPDLHARLLYRCAPCNAHVGTHSRSGLPLGTPANAETRKARMAAHNAFDPLWRLKWQVYGISKQEARSEAYAWLSEQLCIPRDWCHIGEFDAALCGEVVALCSEVRRRNEVRANLGYAQTGRT